MKIISYRLTTDSGFAPNPFHKVLTLATCKPAIRRSSETHVGDWLFGFSSTGLQKKAKRQYGLNIDRNTLLYIAKISKILPYYEYFSEYPEKQAKFDGTIIEQAGDNIYYKDSSDSNNSYKQLKNVNHDDSYYIKDTNGINALICEEFYYFGREGILLNDEIMDKIQVTDRGHCKTEGNVEEIIEEILKWIKLNYGNEKGQIGLPCLWDGKTQYKYKSKSRC